MHWLLKVFLELLRCTWSWRFSVCMALGLGAVVTVYTVMPAGGYRVYLGMLFAASGFLGGLLWEMGRKRDDTALLAGRAEDRELFP